MVDVVVKQLSETNIVGTAPATGHVVCFDPTQGPDQKVVRTPVSEFGATTKIDKDLSVYSPLSLNVLPRWKKDDLIYLARAGEDPLYWTPEEAAQYIQNRPHNIVGNGTTNDGSALSDYADYLTEIVKTETGNPAVLILPQHPLGDAILFNGLALEPLISVRGSGRAITRMRLANNIPITHSGALNTYRGAFLCLPRRYGEGEAQLGMMPVYQNISIFGNSANQSGNYVYGFASIRAEEDPDFDEDEDQAYGGACYFLCEGNDFTGDIFHIGRGRRRAKLLQSKGTSCGTMSGSTIVLESSPFRILGLDPTMSGCGGGGGTDATLNINSVSGFTATDINMFEPRTAARSDSCVAVKFVNPNGGSLAGGNVEGQVIGIAGAQGNRAIQVSVNFRPGKNSINGADGVLFGTATDRTNCHIHSNGLTINAEACSFLADGQDEVCFKYLATARNGGCVNLTAPMSNVQGTKPYAVSIGMTEDDESFIFYDVPTLETRNREISGKVVFPSIAQDLPAPAAGIGWAELDASRGMRGMKVISVSSAQVSFSGPNPGYYRVNAASNHLSYTGCHWSLFSQQDNTATDFDYHAVGDGAIIWIDADTLDIPIVDVPGAPESGDGPSTSKFWLVNQQMFTPKSVFLRLNRMLNGTLKHRGCFSAGSSNPLGLILNTHELAKIYATQIQFIFCTLGTGNAVLKSLSDAISVSAMLDLYLPTVEEFLDYWVVRGVFIAFQGIPASETGDNGTVVRYGYAMDKAISGLIESKYGGKAYFLPLSRFLMEPGTGVVNPYLVDTGGGVHQNGAGAEAVAVALYEPVSRVLPPQVTGEYPITPFDRLSEDGTNVIEGFWGDGTFINPATLDADFGGGATALMADFAAGNITTGGGAAAVLFSRVADPRGTGAEAQAFVISSTGGNNTMTLALTGPTGDEFGANIPSGVTARGGIQVSVQVSNRLCLEEVNVQLKATISGGVGDVDVAGYTNVSAFSDADLPDSIFLDIPFKNHIVPANKTVYWINFNIGLTATAGDITIVIMPPFLEEVV